jgi:hypothetical protein
MGERWRSKGFCRFDREERVPAHLRRTIDGVVDLCGLRARLALHYGHTGRPSIDPDPMILVLFTASVPSCGS